MLNRVLWMMVVVALIAVPALVQAEAAKPAPRDIVVVKVKGEGTDKESAKADALRKAIEQGGKQEIASFSQAENYVLIRDTIYSRSEGIVVDYKILKEQEGVGGSYIVEIEAKVDKSAIATSWGEVQNVLDQIGRPKIMVYVKERVDNNVQSSSILESKIEERLVKSGFDVVAKTAVDEIRKRESADAAAEDDVKKIQAIAKNFNAQLYIIGHANANFAEMANMYGVTAAMYNCDAMAKMYYTDTGKLIASESIPVTRRGARGAVAKSPQAGKRALAAGGEQLIEKIYVTAMKNWATQSSFGGEVMLEISGLKFSDANKIKKMLGKVPDITRVHMKFSKGIATYRLVAKRTGEELAGALATEEFEKLFEIQDLTLNRIQAKAAGQ